MLLLLELAALRALAWPPALVLWREGRDNKVGEARAGGCWCCYRTCMIDFA